jgi:hypothetical protein
VPRELLRKRSKMALRCGRNVPVSAGEELEPNALRNRVGEFADVGETCIGLVQAKGLRRCHGATSVRQSAGCGG